MIRDTTRVETIDFLSVPRDRLGGLGDQAAMIPQRNFLNGGTKI